MSSRKSFTRQQQRAAAAAKKGLAKHISQDDTGLAAKIGGRAWIFDEYRTIYNICCPTCRSLIMRTGGKASFDDYCAACQIKIRPHLETIKTMLGVKNDS